METVGKLDDEDAPVARHRDEHLADRGGLLGLFRVELEPVELGDAVDDGRDLGPEAPLDLVEREARVLDGVVEDGGGDRPGVEPEMGDDAGHCERVGDVRLARVPNLPAVYLFGQVAGPHHQVAALVVETRRACSERVRELRPRAPLAPPPCGAMQPSARALPSLQGTCRTAWSGPMTVCRRPPARTDRDLSAAFRLYLCPFAGAAAGGGSRTLPGAGRLAQLPHLVRGRACGARCAAVGRRPRQMRRLRHLR